MEITEQNIENIIDALNEESSYCAEEIRKSIRRHDYSLVS